MFIGLGISAAHDAATSVPGRQLARRGYRCRGYRGCGGGSLRLRYCGPHSGSIGLPDSTGGRCPIPGHVEGYARVPIIGYGTPRMEPSIGVSMGTQGYLWTLMFCFGFVGLALFLLFI